MNFVFPILIVILTKCRTEREKINNRKNSLFHRSIGRVNSWNRHRLVEIVNSYDISHLHLRERKAHHSFIHFDLKASDKTNV